MNQKIFTNKLEFIDSLNFSNCVKTAYLDLLNSFQSTEIEKNKDLYDFSDVEIMEVCENKRIAENPKEIKFLIGCIELYNAYFNKDCSNLEKIKFKYT